MRVYFIKRFVFWFLFLSLVTAYDVSEILLNKLKIMIELFKEDPLYASLKVLIMVIGVGALAYFEMQEKKRQDAKAEEAKKSE